MTKIIFKHVAIIAEIWYIIELKTCRSRCIHFDKLLFSLVLANTSFGEFRPNLPNSPKFDLISHESQIEHTDIRGYNEKHRMLCKYLHLNAKN